ncbi:twin-arginine translocase subunit TatC [Polyangium sp. 6x1]|uniref:twin-arginine translocase subunit TatC n=1 Tax=Polyangium sp. 6x1 TaxID=3042689 RepID=UPI002483021F|nr:twin-arginine translocase subunit TatC [Polyangium sp. 6x1]MDI1445219.1 twin-arginine translocase subunit TatC [Polyangium sp. 6x1]
MSDPKANAVKDAASAPIEDEEGTPMTFWEHLDELRKRLVYSFVAFLICCLLTWEYHDPLLHIITLPFKGAWATQGLPGVPELHFQSPQAAFIAYFQLSLLGSIVLSAPVIFYQLWAFIAPGLYAREKRFVIPFVLSASGLFAGGCYFGWRVAFPITFNYFLGLAGTIGGGQGVTITPTIMMDEYIDFVTRMLFAFGIVFEIPLLILFLSLAGIVNYLQLIRFGRWFVLLSFIIAAVVTPPDITSQIVMAVPMLVLYLLSIGLAFIFGKKPTEAQREAYRKSKEKTKTA